MLTSISLQNFKSFGALVEVPLEQITVLVGPNNSGKSCFLSVPRFIGNIDRGGPSNAIVAEGGDEYLVHRPAFQNEPMRIEWRTPEGRIEGDYRPGWDAVKIGKQAAVEQTGDGALELAWVEEGILFVGNRPAKNVGPFAVVRELRQHPIVVPMLQSVSLRLVSQKLQSDSPVVENPELLADGTGMAAVLGAWRGSQLELADRLDEFLGKCVPEIKHAIVKNTRQPGHQRVWFKQTDGQEFDAQHASEGLLMFTAIAMHILLAKPGTSFFVEEPEQGIHPRRLCQLVEMMRVAVQEHKCQFVVATHSSVLLNAFRDDPESIMLFRRGGDGTEVRRCTEIPDVVDALQSAGPGEMLETAFFEALWPEKR